ncbi:RimJ/RimL family protein N-acetyltransferase [Nocardioides sp. BE266]|uniref:GNAT family N-acetyltransferase n=1 Tax=Nocardioides sp. BE266 TaxID=2817725 RepID=UPI00285E6F49|nr:GNAT family protein [Nocardioides sp. BE266]MDR7252612.1 RimJ/RimL family protein N-acetyltransferase [Nocardioides sp. BE266]
MTGLVVDLPIETERLLLRPHRMDDLDDLARFHGDPEVVRYVPWPVRDRAATEETLKVKLTQTELLAHGQWLVLAVEERSSGRVIGEVLMKWASDEQGEVGFAFAREAQGQGYAAEAATAMLRLAFDDLGFRRITAVVVEGNEPSVRLLGRLGFRQEARFVEGVFFKGAWVTQLVLALTADEWRSPRSPSSDTAEIQDVIRRFLDAFTSGPAADVDARLDDLRAVMLPGAVVVRTCGVAPELDDVESFISPRRTILTDGTLTGFSEHAGRGRVDVFGDVAHWFGRYTKDGVMDGERIPGAGMKSVQLVRTADGWRISAMAWDDERDGLALADHVSLDVTQSDSQKGPGR